LITTDIDDNYFMQEALRLAKLAEAQGEIPVGALVVWEGKIIGKGYNQTVVLNDPTAHAEMIAITAACNHIGSRYLHECTLYTTLEPCVMCAGACYWAMLKKIVYAASDEKHGCEKVGKLLFHPKTEVLKGVLMEESSLLLKSFFKKLRI
jgi:tRNA(adenine34) deaminase